MPAEPGSLDPEALEPAPDGAQGADAAPAAAANDPVPADPLPPAEPADAGFDGPADPASPSDEGPAEGVAEGVAEADTVEADASTPAPDASDRPRAPLAMLVSTDDPRSADPAVCPYLRLDAGGTLVAPYHSPADEHQCVAYGAPRPQSLRQQELVCLRAEHVDCPRYIRGQAEAGVIPALARTGPAIPRATVAALLILILSAGISFGFVLQRGGIDLPVVGSEGSQPPVAIVTNPTPAPTAAPTTAPSIATPVPSAATESPSEAPTPTPTPTPTPAPPSATPLPTEAPTATPPPTPRPTPRPTATPRSDRYAVLRPCPDRKGCWIYTVRAGDNLFSIAHWFGHPISTIYAWNPQYAQGAHLRAGDQIRMPPPTR